MTPGFSRTIDICVERVALDAHTLLLDVPCGKGEAMTRLASSGCRTIGVDRSPQLLEQAAAKVRGAQLQTRAPLVLGDGGHMPFPAGVFDVCLSIGGPSCIGGHELANVLCEQARVLKPGAYLVMSDIFRDEADPNPWIPTDHPDAAGWWQLLERAGFRVVFFEHFTA